MRPPALKGACVAFFPHFPLCAALLPCALLPAVAFASPELEVLKAAGERMFFEAAAPAGHVEGPTPKFSRDVLRLPKIEPLLREQTIGRLLGRITLSDLLAKRRGLLTMQLGPSVWTVDIAGDASFAKYFLLFRQGERLLIKPLGDPRQLADKKGVDMEIEPGLSYNFHIEVKMWSSDPVRQSRLQVRPKEGVQGPSYDFRIGDILDAIKSQSFVFFYGGMEYWTLYANDVDPATGALAPTRSFLFFHEECLSSRGWHFPESAVPVGQVLRVSLDDQKLVLERANPDELVISGLP